MNKTKKVINTNYKKINIPNISLIELFRDSTKKNKDKNCTFFKGKFKSYKEVEEEVNRLSNSFINMGIKKGDRIAVYLPNCPQFITTFFAAQSIGAIFTSLNPLYTVKEIVDRLKDCNPKVIVTLRLFTNKIRDVQKEINVEKIVITSISEELPFVKKYLYKLIKMFNQTKIDNEILYIDLIEKGENKKVDIKISPKEDVAILQYTGGTTGSPKGAMLTHYNLLSQAVIISYWKDYLSKTPKDQYKVGGILPFSHIFGLTSSFIWPIYEGANLFLVPDPRKLVEVMKIIHNHNLHILYCVPIFFKKFACHEKLNKYDLSSLHLAVSGGESLPNETVQIFEEKTKCLLIEGYGLTEASPVTHINPPNKTQRKIGSIGVTFPETRAKIVDPVSGKVINGIEKSGELWINGPGVMKGYWNNKAETDIALKNGWLRTGDIVKKDQNGYYQVVDRLKDVIIVSGYNVWPSEVETVLLTHHNICEAAVVNHQTENGSVVKAFLVKKSGCPEVSLEELRSFCRASLAPYKIPKIIEYRDKLPRSAVGKVIRRKLRENK